MLASKFRKAKSLSLNSQGFTLVELLMAMAFFSMMMVLIAVGVIQVMKIYQSNLSTRRTQQTARIILEDMSREIRAAINVEADSVGQRLCLESTKTTEYIIVGDELQKKILQGNCDNPGATLSQASMAGGSGSQVAARKFRPSPIDNANGDIVSVSLSLVITTGDDDLLETSGEACRPGPGSQYCSATSYTSVISLRGSSL